MLASEHVKIIQDLIAIHGDQEILVDCPGMMDTRPIEEVDIAEEGIVIWPER